MVKQQFLSFSALLVGILPRCRWRDCCGNLRKASGHVVCRLDQSASFRIFDSTFTFRIPHFRILPIAFWIEHARNIIICGNGVSHASVTRRTPSPSTHHNATLQYNNGNHHIVTLRTRNRWRVTLIIERSDSQSVKKAVDENKDDGDGRRRPTHVTGRTDTGSGRLEAARAARRGLYRCWSSIDGA